MKLLVVTSLNEYQKKVAGIFKQAKISIFSVSETIGYKEKKTQNLVDGWFAAGADQFDSIVLFSFTEEANANHALELIKEYNATKECKFPIRAFIMPVEKSSYEV
jgi:hypothetical protein